MMKPDISTERGALGIRAHDALAMREAQMHALLEAAVDGIISIDERGIIQTINPAAERMFGYPEDELVGQSIKLLMPSPYQEEHDGYIARYLATGEKRIIGIGREAFGRRKHGTTFPIDLSVAEAQVGSKRIFVGIVRDITERKRAEEKRLQLATIVESSDDAIIGKDLRGIIVTWNAAAERMCGYSAREVIGQPIYLIVPPDREEELRAIHERIRRGESIYHFETVWVRKDGQQIDISLTISPIKDVTGRIIGSSAIARDITQGKRTNEALRQSKERLQEAVTELQAKNQEMRTMSQQLWQAAKLASVGELAASIAHELNNPLATVSLRVESVLASTSANDPRRRPLEIIEEETKRMGELVGNLLQLSRRHDGQVSTLDVCEELTKAVELIHHHLCQRLISVAQEFAPDTPTIYGDRQKLRQVFLNLLTNASDAMPQGGKLTMRTAPTTLHDGKPAVSIEFSDTGVGIPAENLERIMEPFFTTKEEGKGTGLGLAICRRVVSEHHGTIQIASKVGKGSTVRILLPIRNGTNAERLRGAESAV